MPVKNNGPGMTGRSSMTKKSKVEPEYPQWAESKMRAIENRRLKELQKIVRESIESVTFPKEESNSERIELKLKQVSINSTETANISIKYARGGTSKKNTGASQKSTSTAKSSSSGKSSSRSSILCSGAKAIGLFK